MIQVLSATHSKYNQWAAISTPHPKKNQQRRHVSLVSLICASGQINIFLNSPLCLKHAGICEVRWLGMYVAHWLGMCVAHLFGMCVAHWLGMCVAHWIGMCVAHWFWMCVAHWLGMCVAH